MSDINPRGVPVKFADEERHFLFDYSVIAELPEAYDSAVLSIVRQLWMENRSPGEYRAKVLIDLVHKLLLDECEREKALHDRELKMYTKRQVGWFIDQHNADSIVEAILKAWTVSIPAPDTDEDESPNGMRGTETTTDSTSPE